MKVSALPLVVCALALARHGAAAPDAISPPQAHFRLSNGLDVLIEENHREPHVAVVVAYDVGTRDDPAARSSLAHLVEHLTFRRSRHLKDYAGLELLGRAGAENANGETQRDRTLYYAVVPSKALPLALWIESERMGFTLEAFDEAAVNHERDVVRAEVVSKQTGYTRLVAHAQTALYGEGHPYAEPETAANDIDDLTLPDTQWFFQRGYRPDNAHLVIVGDVTLAEGRGLAEHYFGGLANPAATLAPRPALAPARFTGSHLTYRSREYAAYFLAAYRAPPRGARAHLAAELLAQVLRLRLTPLLVDQRRVALGLKLELVDTAADSLFVLQLIPRQGIGSASLAREVRAALAKVPPRLAEDLREARAALLEREWLMLEDPLARARAHVEALASEGHPRDAEARAPALLALTAADLTPVLESLRAPLLTAEQVTDRGVGLAGAVELL